MERGLFSLSDELKKDMISKRAFVLLAITFLFGCSAALTTPLRNPQTQSPGETVRFFYDSQGGKVEGYLVRPKGDGPFPLMVLLHGHSWIGVGASRIVPVAEQFSSELCYAGLAISMPGYGNTEVAGDSDQDIITGLVLDGIAKVGELPWIDQNRLLLYGFSRGAVFAAASVNRISHLRAVVLHSGAYDLPRLYQETPTLWVRRFLNPNGEPSPSLFTILPETSAWSAPTLILHGAQDNVIPVNQAQLLNDQLEAMGKPHHLVIFPEADHRLPSGQVRDEVRTFLQQQVGSACERR
jgi:dipeptidyl aminopeptidase/acylaminoacyl peptidase